MKAAVEREIEVLIISAQHLTNVKHVTRMRPYAVVYVEQDFPVAKTRVDEEGGLDPTWDEVVKVKFRVEDNVMAALNVDVYAHGRVREKLVGSARVLLSDVLKDGVGATQRTTIQVWKEGKPRGLVNLWVPPSGRFSEEEVVVGPVEVTAEMVEEKLGSEMVLLGSRAHSALDLGVLGGQIDRSSSV